MPVASTFQLRPASKDGSLEAYAKEADRKIDEVTQLRVPDISEALCEQMPNNVVDEGLTKHFPRHVHPARRSFSCGRMPS